MKHFLDEKISSIVKNETKQFDSMNIRIECPFETGVKVECHGQRGADVFSPAIPGGVRTFFKFVEMVRKNNAADRFNVVDIKIKSDGRYTTNFSFDDEVQRNAEENVRQD